MTIKINGDNSVANPGFTGADTDTGLKVGTDELTLVTGGSEALTVDFEGKVGIGTNAPEWALDVQRDINTLARFKRDTDGNSYIRLNSHGGNLAGFQLGDDTAIGKQSITSDNTNNALYFNTANFERVRIDSSGNVGIGTTGPDERLHLRRSDSAAVSLKFTNSAATTGLFVGINASEEAQIWHAENKPLKFATNNTERVRIDASGNVGIGTSSPNNRLAIQQSAVSNAPARAAALYIENNANCEVQMVGNASNDCQLRFGTSGNSFKGAVEYQLDVNALVAYTNSNERLRINSSGAVEIGAADGVGVLRVGSSNNNPSANDIEGITLRNEGSILSNVRSSGAVSEFRANANQAIIRFRRSSSVVGSISVTTTNTSYSTSSDHRLKENVVDLDGAITRVKQLAPKRFNFIADAETTVDGFLAHEAQTVVPEAITGTHNEVDENGDPVYQGIDHSKLVPLLTAALQETISKIETLETQNADLLARVTALENA